MAARTLQTAAPGDEAEPQPSRTTHPVVLGLTSAVLLWLAFPPAGLAWLGWCALVPLFLLIRSDRSRRSIYLGAWLGGLAFWLMAIQWVRLTDPGAWIAWVAMAGALSLEWPVFLLAARLTVRRGRLPLMLVVPILWVSLEYVRAYVLSGFPWYYLAHSQYRALVLIQVADLTGAWGLSFLMALVNAWGVELVTLPLFRPTARGPRLTRPQAIRLGLLAAGLGATLAYGGYRLRTADFRAGPRVALLQSNIEQRYKMQTDPDQLLAGYEVLVDRALAEGPDLIVWPETAYPYGFVAIAPDLDETTFASLGRKGSLAAWTDRMRQISDHLHGWTDRTNVPMVLGTAVSDFSREGYARYNAAVLIQPGSPAVQTYHKLHLVPFGEYVPLIETFPFLVALTPYDDAHLPNLAFGKGPAWFDLKGLRLAPAICFEDTVPHVVRRFFAEARAGQQPDLLLNLSNDGWFQGSEENDMHLAISVFRAVENRVPLARAANTGISALIDGNGSIRAAAPKNRAQALVAAAPLDDRTSLYSVWGDWLARGCLATSLGLILLVLVRPAPPSRPTDLLPVRS